MAGLTASDDRPNARETVISPSGAPLVEEISPVPDVMQTLSRFADEPDVLLLESALPQESVGRYSFLTADPVERFRIQDAEHGSDPFHAIRHKAREFVSPAIPELPPFQGGAAGLLGYELGHAWEELPRSGRDEFQFPDLAVGIYDWVVAWDHVQSRAWIISQGYPERTAARRTDRASARLTWIKKRLGATIDHIPSHSKSTRLSKEQLAPSWPAPGAKDLNSDFSRDAYLEAVDRAKEYIYAGDIFQANLSQRLLAPDDIGPVELYSRLRARNAAPFAGYFACDDWAVVSASPERLVSLRGDEIETRPIKGTRRRRPIPEADLFTRDELRASEKDTAENVMIVDLLRNDLSRVCVPGTVRVPQLCGVEMYATVQHLVSVVRARIAGECDVWELFNAVFPGGSITGAPKIRAMEIIDELEPTVRGPYCGSLFYVGFDGRADSSILIRTFICRNGWIQCPVGGGIVAQSNAADEYLETMHKAEGMLRALE